MLFALCKHAYSYYLQRARPLYAMFSSPPLQVAESAQPRGGHRIPFSAAARPKVERGGSQVWVSPAPVASPVQDIAFEAHGARFLTRKISFKTQLVVLIFEIGKLTSTVVAGVLLEQAPNNCKRVDNKTFQSSILASISTLTFLFCGGFSSHRREKVNQRVHTTASFLSTQSKISTQHVKSRRRPALL